MHRILLVDDEWLELDTLEHYISWNEFGFTVSGTAQNGQQALDWLKNNPLPDVLITDVKMPVMDGISLSKTVHELYPSVQIVFLSGYNDFEYVRQALAVEACGYILKPLDLEELKNTMQKVFAKCSEIKKKQQANTMLAAENTKHLLRFLNGENSEDWDEICQTCNVYFHLPLDNRSFFVGLLTIDEYRFLSRYVSGGKMTICSIYKCIHEFTESKHILSFHINDYSYLLLSACPLHDMLKQFLSDENEYSRWLTACVYHKPYEPEKFPSLYDEMNRLQSFHVHMYGSGHLIVCDVSDNQNTSPCIEKSPDFSDLTVFLQKGDLDAIHSWIAGYCSQQQQKGRNLSNCAIELSDRIYSTVISPTLHSSQLLEEKTTLYQKLASAEGNALIQMLLNHFLENLSLELTSKNGDRLSQLMEQVIKIIQSEYSTPLTIEYLAEKIYVSPNYLRTLFKNYTGKTVLEYITDIRMEASARMLTTTNLRISEISLRIGYENPSYYCAVFKKLMGLTPNQYRTKFSEEN